MTRAYRSLLRLLARRGLVIPLGVALILLGGLTSLGKLPIDLFPDLDYPLINVVTQYPAGTPEDVETLITRPIESALSGLPRLSRLRSISTAGISRITAEFVWGTDLIDARQLVLSGLGQAVPLLPEGATPEIENVGTSIAVIATYTLAGAPPKALRAWADYEMAPALAAIPGVARIEVMGGQRAALRADLDPLRLAARGLGPADVVGAIRAGNALGTGGVVEAHGRDLPIAVSARIETEADLARVLLHRDEDGEPLLLGDVARVYAGALPERYTITANHAPAVAFSIQKQMGASTLALSRAVDAKLAELALPEGARISKFYDQAEIIGSAFTNMRDQLLIGALLAVVALFWALGRTRVAFVLALSIPMSVIATFILMDWAGLGINLMTLGALTVTIGMISDDAVLVMENIVRHHAAGTGRARASEDGAMEILGPDIAGTLTTIAAFAPLVLLTGIAGRLFVPFGLGFSFVLLLSLVFSLTIIPWACARWLAPARARRTSSGRFFAWLGRVNARPLEVMLAHPLPTIAAASLLLAASLALLTLNPVRFLPLLDESSLLVSYQLAPGTSLRESDRLGHELETLVLEHPGVAAVFRRTGSPGKTFFIEGPDQGELVLRLDRASGFSAEAVKRDLESRLASLPGVLTRINEPTSEKLDESFAGLPALFGITVFSDDLERLHAAAEAIEAAAGGVAGIGKVVNNTKIPLDSLAIEIDRGRAARLGVAPRTVAETVGIAIQGEIATRSLVGGRIVRVFVSYAPEFRRSPAELARILIPGEDGAPIPLGALATIRPRLGHPLIEHQFGTRSATMTAEIEGNPIEVVAELDRAIEALDLGPGVRVAFTGQYQQLAKTALQTVWILLGAAALVFGIMAIQLRSGLDALIVLVKLPIDFAGAALALFAVGQALDVTVVIGFITLIGVGVNNGIVLLSFARDRREEGLDARAAIREAVRVRLRPMVLTWLTTVSALLPALAGLGAGPQLLQPLGIMLAGGLTVGTLMTLNFIPVLYVASERWRRAPGALAGG